MIADAIWWLLRKPDTYEYPDHYDDDAFHHALRVIVAPTPWRWYVRLCIRAWKAVAR